MSARYPLKLENPLKMETTQSIEFFKYESLGNDFVLIESSADTMDFSSLAKTICRRRFGIGSDGLLVLDRSTIPRALRMFNPDGSEDFCGNGLRCAALHLSLYEETSDALLLHGGDEIPVSLTTGGWIDVTLPRPSFEPRRVPLAEGIPEMFDSTLIVEGHELTATAVNTGTTHTVLAMESPPDEEVFQKVSAALEHHPYFPERTSVIWLWQVAYNVVRIRIWERGVGETLGCGTGSAAAAAYLFRKKPGLLSVGVENPGGDCAVAKGPEGKLVVSAKAHRVYRGKFSFAMVAHIQPEFSSADIRTTT